MSDRPTLLLEHHLKELKLPTFLREYGKIAAQCASEGVDYPDYLLRLSELELIDRHHRLVARRIKAARFPAVKSLDAFDFGQVPGRGVRVRHPDCTTQAAVDCVNETSCSASCFVVTPGVR